MIHRCTDPWPVDRTHKAPSVAPPTMHGPDRPPIIAHRYWCPSCDAPAGEPCRLSPQFTQDYSHESRHQVARRAMWRALMHEIDSGTGPISSLGFGSL